MVDLRDYQDDLRERVDKAIERAVCRLLIVLPTGMGKTIVFAELIRRCGGRAIVIAHREELIVQAVAKLMDADPSLRPTINATAALYASGRADLAARQVGSRRVGIVKARSNDVRADVVVCSIQTLRQNRLDALVMSGDFKMVVVDEAHHARADTYQHALQQLLAGEQFGPLLLGVTATPDRGDGKGLDSIFDEIIAPYDLLWGINNGYLSDLRAVEVPLLGFDEKTLKVRGGDFTVGSSGLALEAAHAPEMIPEAWLREAKGRQTLVFLPTVATTQATAEAFVQKGIKAAWVSGTTDPDERRHILQDFAARKITVLVNCMVLTEGYDEPSVECVVLARPTKSRSLYAQMIGRGTRRFPMKADCLILDIVGDTHRHDLITLPSLFGIEPTADTRNGSVTITEAVEAHEARVAARLGQSRTATLFRAMPASQISWAVATGPDGTQQYVKSLGSRMVDGEVKHLPMVVLAPAEGESWSVGLLYDDRMRYLMHGVPMAMAQGVGEDYIRKNVTAKVFADADAPWLDRPPSEKMIAACEKWRMPIDPAWTTAREYRTALDAFIAAKKLAKAAKHTNQGARP